MMSIRSTLARAGALLVLASMIAAPQYARAQGRARQPLSYDQLTELVKLAPDAAVTSEIRDRGLSFSLEPRQLETLKKLGLGPATLKQLSPLVRDATLLVRTEPVGATVSLNGKPVGEAGSGGLRLRVRSGTHQIAVAKTRYREAVTTQEVKAGAEAAVSVALEPTFAVLAVPMKIQGARLGIEGRPDHSLPATGIELEPGSYAVSLKAPELEESTKHITLAAGQRLELMLPVRLRPDILQNRLGDAARELRAGNHRAARESAKRLLEIDPGEPQALSLASEASYLAADVQSFSTYARQALHAGGTLQFPLLHHHTMIQPHKATLSVSTTAFGFSPSEESGSNCTFKSFKLPLLYIAAHRLLSPSSEERYLELDLRDPKNPKKTHSIKLAPADASVQRGTSGRLRSHALVSGYANRSLMAALTAVFEEAVSLNASLAREATFPVVGGNEPFDGPASVSELAGRWKGEAKEAALPAYPVLMTIGHANGQVVGAIAAPTIGCESRLQLQGAAAPPFRFSETLVKGVGFCVPGAWVVRSSGPGRLQAEWLSADGKSTGTAVFLRVE